MNFKTPVTVSLELLKEFVYEAKRRSFAATDTKTTLPDQSSVYSFRPFSDPRFGGLIYADTYNGNTIEGGQESVTLDLVLRWRNQYYGGTKRRFANLADNPGGIPHLEPGFLEIGARFPEIVSAFLKQALMELPAEFPVRGPHNLRATEVKFENGTFCGQWTYSNTWDAVPLFETNDPFAAYIGQERISLNGVEVYWHAYQGGLVHDKYFPGMLKPPSSDSK